MTEVVEAAQALRRAAHAFAGTPAGEILAACYGEVRLIRIELEQAAGLTGEA
jgi:hypothetical protein